MKLDRAPRHLLVVKNRALGDALISLGTISYLKEILPQTKITYLVPDWVEPLFREARTEADQVVGFSLKSFSGWIKAFKMMRALDPDCVFEMSQSGRGKSFFSLYSFFTDIPYFAHNHHLKNGPVFDQGVQKAIIQRDLDGAWSFFADSEKPPSYLNYPPKFVYPPTKQQKRLILGIVATRETKMYPLKKYAEFAEHIQRVHPDYEVVALVSKSDVDQSLAKTLKALNPKIQIVNLSLTELPQYFSQSRLYVGNDTGLKHIAVAAGIPSITLFGPEPPLEWHPYDTKKHIYLYREPLACRFEIQPTYCPLAKCESMACLNGFEPLQIYQRIQEFLV